MAHTAKLENTPSSTNFLDPESAMFHNGVGVWISYVEAAPGSSPTDGTGGVTPLVNGTRSTTLPLKTPASLLVSKTGSPSTAQGHGISAEFYVPLSSRASILSIDFDYIIDSGTFVAGSDTVTSDITVWLYDIDNATIIQPTPYILTSGSTITPGKYKGTFQTSATGTQYRLILHKGTTNTADFSLKFDNFRVGPSSGSGGSGGGIGTPVTDWIDYTPTGTLTTNTTYTGKWRRVGDSLEVEAKLAFSGANTQSLGATISLPSGLVIDTTKILSAVNDNQSLASTTVTIADINVTSYHGALAYNSTTTVAIRYFTDDLGTGTNLIGSTAFNPGTTPPFTIATGDFILAKFTVPIVGWSSNVQMSNDTDTRVVAFSAYKASNQAVASSAATKFAIDTASLDTHGAFVSGSNRWVCPVSGVYRINFQWYGNSVSDAVALFADIYKNGSLIATNVGVSSSVTINAGAFSTSLVNLVAGDYIEGFLRTDADTSYNAVGGATASTLSIQRLSGPSTIAASEKVFLQYNTNGGTALTANVTNIDFITKVTDSHGAWSGTVFTTPRSGFYCIEGMIRTSANTTSQLGLYVNGTEVLNMTDDVSENYKTFSGSRYLNAGDTVSIRTDTAATLQASTSDNWIAIYSQG